MSVCKRAIELESLTAILQAHLPAQYHAYCTVGGFNNGCLTLQVTQPLLATELRYLLPDLRDTLRSKAGLYQLVNIKMIVDSQ